jgi:hypothetical protein
MCRKYALDHFADAHEFLEIGWFSKVGGSAESSGFSAIRRGIGRGEEHHRNAL